MGRTMLRAATIVLALSFTPWARAEPPEGQTALDRYVAAPDPSYRYDLVRTPAGWRVKHLVFNATWTEGNVGIMAASRESNGS